MFDYDRAMADEQNDVFTNTHSKLEDLPEDPTANYDLDDFGTIVHDEDIIFITYFTLPSGFERKFVLQQENFFEMLEELGFNAWNNEKIKLHKGKDWLEMQREAN